MLNGVQLSGRTYKKFNVRKREKVCVRQRGRVVRAPDLKSGGLGFKSCSDR